MLKKISIFALACLMATAGLASAETLINGAKDDPIVATRFLRTIEKHADRLTYLIEDLLTISRLESG